MEDVGGSVEKSVEIHGVLSQKKTIFILTAVKIPNLTIIILVRLRK
jgi:hypothetical protein